MSRIISDGGSTTLAAHLCDLGSGEVVASAGRMNPQIRFGEDLMSRVSYSMMNPGGAVQMFAGKFLADLKALNLRIDRIAPLHSVVAPWAQFVKEASAPVPTASN